MAINEQVYQMAHKVCDKWNEYYISVYPVLQFLLCHGLILSGRDTLKICYEKKVLLHLTLYVLLSSSFLSFLFNRDLERMGVVEFHFLIDSLTVTLGSFILEISPGDAINYRLWSGCHEAEWGLQKFFCIHSFEVAYLQMGKHSVGNIYHSVGQTHVWFQTFLEPACSPKEFFQGRNWHLGEKWRKKGWYLLLFKKFPYPNKNVFLTLKSCGYLECCRFD